MLPASFSRRKARHACIRACKQDRGGKTGFEIRFFERVGARCGSCGDSTFLPKSLCVFRLVHGHTAAQGPSACVPGKRASRVPIAQLILIFVLDHTTAFLPLQSPPNFQIRHLRLASCCGGCSILRTHFNRCFFLCNPLHVPSWLRPLAAAAVVNVLRNSHDA